jgi:hypothetical protein
VLGGYVFSEIPYRQGIKKSIHVYSLEGLGLFEFLVNLDPPGMDID